MEAGWLHLVAVLDWYSRYVVSWELDLTLELPFVLAATARALTQATPQIWNSDQGSHITSPRYLALLQAADVAISMDGKGRAPRQHLHNSVSGALLHTRRCISLAIRSQKRCGPA